jgi:FtsP/CotA-like multicopper oxidase with cupredoxin domain
MTTGVGPYVTPDPTDIDPSLGTLETTFTASHGMVDIGLGGGVMAHAEMFNGAIPGPTLRLNVGDTVIVRLVNDLDHPTGIHWHGIELSNSADGTEVTQNAVVPAFPMPPPPPAPPGGTYLYKFKVYRPGIFWYHPHHHASTNRVFRGMYGMIVVTDPNEALIAAGVLPTADPDHTRQIVLSDITICKAPGSNDTATYVDPTTLPAGDRPEWLSGATAQTGPTPVQLCEIPPGGVATDDDGSPAAASYAAGDVPSIINAMVALTVEGQTVLTNGVTVGGRLGTPSAPGAMAGGAQTLDVLSGQGLRLQIANCSTIRYCRLTLTTSTGVQVPLVRVGGEGGLLDNAVVEGGVVGGPGGFDSKYTPGEILLPAGSRADVVAAIPAGEPVNSVLTLWTRDFQRTGPVNPGNWAQLPTVPVMHLKVTGAAPATYSIANGTPLRASIPGAAVETLVPTPGAALLVPSTFVPAKPGMPVPGSPATQDIRITVSPPSVNGVSGTPLMMGSTPYTSTPHINSSRYAQPGETLEMMIINTSQAHHPFHLHGFSIQPVSLTRTGFPTFTWPYREFRDNIDIPAGYTLTCRVRFDDRELKDGMTLGGALGRWLFHCHIFFHHHQGMIGELVVTAANGREKPNVDVGGSWAYTPAGGIAQRFGTYHHHDGDPVTLTASDGVVVDTGGGSWSWTLDSTGMAAGTRHVYITATDASGRKDQAAFRLKIGAPDDGADNGDPHVHTVDGKHYDFQGVGEFVLLRDREGMEVQARHWPVETGTPVTDPATGLTSCVSVNTAVAARVGAHRMAYQPGRDGRRLEFFVDGEPVRLPFDGMDLGPHRVSAHAVDSEATALRVDYASQSILIITPHFWNAYGVWYMNVRVSHTQADEGIMGTIPPDSWLPALPTGASVGPMPVSLHDRHDVLYRTFANAWRVTEETSLFVYEPGMSTKSFTDEDWPALQPPCTLRPQFHVPGANPASSNIPIRTAQKMCRLVTEDDLHRDCVFDVATTGDEEFARAYLLEQDLKRRASSVQILADKPDSRPGEEVTVTATVLQLADESPTRTGTVTFLVDGKQAGKHIRLDKRGRASLVVGHLELGRHSVRAVYGGDRRREYRPSSSPTLDLTVRAGHGPPQHPHKQGRHVA